MINVGDRLARFTLKDHLGEDFDSGRHPGKCLLLSFHPLAWTAVCAAQMKGLEANMDFFQGMGVVPVGISVDAHTAKKPWAESLGITRLKLLSDFWPHGALAETLGVFIGERGFSGRVNVLVDRDDRATVVWVRPYEIPQVPDMDEIVAAVKEHCGGSGCCQ